VAFKRLTHTYNDIISVENLLLAWKEFIRGKRNKIDIQEFQLRLMDNILALHLDLKKKSYRHFAYKHFRISDPKPRDIHKASVQDRLLHHAVYRILYPFFSRNFASDSYSCQNSKETHRAIRRFRKFSNIISKNNTGMVWALKCDIRKFFASIDHDSLRYIVEKYIPDQNINWLLSQII
jgi:RNA-directed DNA polymerase